MKTLDSGNIVGTTPELRKLAEDGRTIRTAFCDFEVDYRPRNGNDPKPWRSRHGEDGFRYNARELYAEAERTPEEYSEIARLVHDLMPKGWRG